MASYPTAVGLGAGFSGFAQGFADVFTQQRMAKERQNAEIRKMLYEKGLEDPLLAASPDFQGMAKGVMDKDEFGHFNTLLAHTTAAQLIAPDLAGGGGQTGGVGAPGAAPAVQPGLPGYTPQSAGPGGSPVADVLQRVRSRLPEGAEVDIGAVRGIKGGLTEAEKEQRFSQQVAALRDHPGNGVESAKGHHAFMGIVEMMKAAGRGNEIPKSALEQYQKMTDALEKIDIEGSPEALKAKQDQAAAAERGKRSVTPAKPSAAEKGTKLAASDYKTFEAVNAQGQPVPIPAGSTWEGLRAAGIKVRSKASGGVFGFGGTPAGPESLPGQYGGAGTPTAAPSGKGTLYDPDHIKALSQAAGID